jgi:dienelactone hydrolase
MFKFESWRAQHDPERIASDIALAYKYLSAQLAEHGAGTREEGRIALLGFCLGGGAWWNSWRRTPRENTARGCHLTAPGRTQNWGRK